MYSVHPFPLERRAHSSSLKHSTLAFTGIVLLYKVCFKRVCERRFVFHISLNPPPDSNSLIYLQKDATRPLKAVVLGAIHSS